MCTIAIEKARQIHQKYPGLDYPLNIERLANLEGCECITWPFTAPVKEVKQGRWIGIAENLPANERRYLVSHALAHHLLHCGNQLSFRGWQKTYCNRQEREADCWAAHMLMPEIELAKVARVPSWELAEQFGVPEELVRRRLSEFATEDEKVRWKFPED